MNRREFFKLAGLGAGGLLLATSAIGAVMRADEEAQDHVDFAVDYALRHGAIYADAQIGPFEIQGHGAAFESLHLLHADLLGMRLCIHEQWRYVMIRDLDRDGIARNLDIALQAVPALQTQTAHWISAHGDIAQRLAYKTSDGETSAALQSGALRFRQRPALPQHGRDLLFCDIILLQ